MMRALEPRAPSRTLAAVLVLVLAAGAMAADPEPLPSGMEGLDSASRRDVVRALGKVRHHYGEDAIVIETQLLMHAMRSGSVRATAVSVDGVRPHEDKRYLAFTVDTGLVFDSATRDETTRVRMLWERIMAPTLARLAQGLRVPADGVAVTMRYHHRPYRRLDEVRTELDRPGTPEETAFYVLGPDVDALLAARETPHTLLARTRVTVDGATRAVTAAPPDLPAAPGPD